MSTASQQTSTPVPDLGWDLADRLRKSLRVADISVQEMADHLEVSRNTVGNWMSGRRSPRTSDLRVWSIRCGLPFEWLKDGIEPKDLPPDHGNAASTWTPPTSSVVPISVNSERRRSTRHPRTAAAA